MTNLEQESYQVLARKYRPNNFAELIGQEVLVQTLTNAIENKKIAHSFILTGIRGVGKTTTARIFAKALNCLGANGLANDAQKTPCDICSNCLAIAASRHQDVVEIDAASKTGIDDMRNIIDTIIYAPAIGRYKVYIIDEVHMLSKQAFNALLKTLEEPPAHIKFIFATTEIRKVPITILSRCQRFDLRRLNVAELSIHLKNILKKEGFEAEENALNFIAQAAEGSVRDSLSIADRVLSHNNYQKILSTIVVEEVLGLNDNSKIIDLFESILEGNLQSVFNQLENFYENSADIIHLITDLQNIVHITTLSKTIDNYQCLSFCDQVKQRVSEIAKKTSLIDLIRIWQMLLKGSIELASSSNQKMIMEMLLIRICCLLELPNLEQVIASNNTDENYLNKTIEIKNNNQDLLGEVKRNFPNAKFK